MNDHSARTRAALYTLGNHAGEIRDLARAILLLTRPSQKYARQDCMPLDQALSVVFESFSRLRPAGDMICWVPSHDGSFGPSEFFAALLSTLWSIPARECLLRNRAVDSAHKSARRPSYEEQMMTMTGVLSSDGAQAILVDNVVATGASLLAGKTVLEQAGYFVHTMCTLSVDYSVLRSRSNDPALLESYREISFVEL